MTGPWPWLAVAGVGALHGLNPATGWAVLAASRVRAGERAQAWRALAPIALGHTGAIALVAASTALGMAAGRGLLPWIAGGAAVVAAAVHASRHLPARTRRMAESTGLALWSLAQGALHGAGMLLVPALVPLCLSGAPAREITATGSLALALAAVAVHLLAMLAVTGALAALAGRCWIALRAPGSSVPPGASGRIGGAPRGQVPPLTRAAEAAGARRATRDDEPGWA